MNVVLIKAPSDFLISDRAMPSLGVLYLSAVLKKNGINAEVIDDWCAIDETYGDTKEDTLFGISATSPQYSNALKILDNIKSVNWKTPVIIGGPHAIVKWRDIIKDGWDGICGGDSAEKTILRIIKNIETGRDDFTFQYDLCDGTNIDHIPYPDRKAIDLHSYTYKIRGRNSTTMITSRGCSYGKCAFCSQVWNNVKYHSVEYVIGELKEIKDLGFSALTLFDDNFGAYFSRDKKISEALTKMGFIWRCISRADTILRNKKLLDTMKHSCQEIALGCESGSDEVLKAIDKGMTVDQNKRAIDIIRKAGIKEKVNIVLGLPQESQETLYETDKFLEEIQPDWVDISILSIYPGSEIYDWPKRYDIKFNKDEYLPYKTQPGKYSCGISTSKLSSEEIIEFRNYLEKKYRKREPQ